MRPPPAIHFRQTSSISHVYYCFILMIIRYYSKNKYIWIVYLYVFLILITGLGQWSDWWTYTGFSGKGRGGVKNIAKTSSVQVHLLTTRFWYISNSCPKEQNPTSLRLIFKPDRVNTIYLTRSFPTLGPSNWRINKDWILCSEGKLQSPINISAESLLFDPGLKNIIVTGNKVANQTEIPHSSVFFIKVLFFFSQIKVLLKQIIQHVGSFSVYIHHRFNR